MVCCQFKTHSSASLLNVHQKKVLKRYSKYSEKHILAQKTKTKRVKNIL